MLLLLVSIVYKFTLEASTRHMFYYNLYKLGYCYKQLLKIIKSEVILFYSLLFLLPFVYIGISLGLSIYHQQVSVVFAMIMVLSMIVPLIIASILTYVSYKNSVLKAIGEGVKYE